MIKVAFRFDDPSITSDHLLEREIIALCRKYETKINFAVIPVKVVADQKKPLTEVKASHLIKAFREETIEISQHGFAHVNRIDNPSNSPSSEFSGASPGQQLEMVSEGKQILDKLFGEYNRGFVPPWNSFDSTTISVINNLNLKFICAGWDLPTEIPHSLINIIPRTCQAAELNNVIKKNLKYSFLSPIIIAVLHHYDFYESGSNEAVMSLKEFESTLKSLKSTPLVELSSLNLIATEITQKDCYIGFNIHNFITCKLHWRLQRIAPESVFITKII